MRIASAILVVATLASGATAQRPGVVVAVRVDSATRSDSAAVDRAIRRGILADSTFEILERPPQPGHAVRGARYVIQTIVSSMGSIYVIAIDVESGTTTTRETVRVTPNDTFAELSAIVRRFASQLPTARPSPRRGVSPADSVALTRAVAQWIRGDQAQYSASNPLVLQSRDYSLSGGIWVERLTAILRAIDPTVLADKPSRPGKRVVIGDIRFDGDSAILGMSLEQCVAGRGIISSSWSSQYTFRRAGNQWQHIKPDRASGVHGDGFRCAW